MKDYIYLMIIVLFKLGLIITFFVSFILMVLSGVLFAPIYLLYKINKWIYKL